MRIDNTVLLLLPMVFVALGAAVRDGAHQDSMVLKILLSVAALTIAVTCLVRGIARIRAEGSGGYLLGVVAVLYLVLLLVMLSPAKGPV